MKKTSYDLERASSLEAIRNYLKRSPEVHSHLANILKNLIPKHVANILIFTPEWSAGYSLFSKVTEYVMNYL